MYIITIPSISKTMAKTYNSEALVAEVEDNKLIAFYTSKNNSLTKVTSQKYTKFSHKYLGHYGRTAMSIDEGFRFSCTRYANLIDAYIVKLRLLDSVRNEAQQKINRIQKRIDEVYPSDVAQTIAYYEQTHPEYFI